MVAGGPEEGIGGVALDQEDPEEILLEVDVDHALEIGADDTMEEGRVMRDTG